MGSFLRHVTSMQSPNNPTLLDTRIYPVLDVEIFEEATLENVAAHLVSPALRGEVAV